MPRHCLWMGQTQVILMIENKYYKVPPCPQCGSKERISLLSRAQKRWFCWICSDSFIHDVVRKLPSGDGKGGGGTLARDPDSVEGGSNPPTAPEAPEGYHCPSCVYYNYCWRKPNKPDCWLTAAASGTGNGARGDPATRSISKTAIFPPETSVPADTAGDITLVDLNQCCCTCEAECAYKYVRSKCTVWGKGIKVAFGMMGEMPLPIPSIMNVYNRFKHLDKLLSDPQWLDGADSVHKVAHELWMEIKKSVEE